MELSKTTKKLISYSIAALIGIVGIHALTPVSIARADDVKDSEKVDIDLFASTPESRFLQIGDRCDRVFSITSLGKSSYIRMSATLESPDFECNFNFDDPKPNDWICAKDGWWYLTFPIGDKQSCDVSTSFHAIPSDGLLEALSHLGEVCIDEHIVAQAIDATDIDLDFNADEPWGKDALANADNKGMAAEKIIETSISGGVSEYGKSHCGSDFNKTGDASIHLILLLTGMAVIALPCTCILRRRLIEKGNSDGQGSDKTNVEGIDA